MFFTLYFLFQHFYRILDSNCVNFNNKCQNLPRQWMKLCRLNKYMKSCVFFSEKLRPQKKISVCDKFQPRQGHHQIVCIASLKKELITKSSVFNFWWTFVFYHVLKRWHDQRGRGLKRLINTKWKESWELLSDVVNMWALDQRSLSFTVIFFSTTFPWLISYSFRRHRYD